MDFLLLNVLEPSPSNLVESEERHFSRATITLASMDEEEFRKHFRMSKDCFKKLLLEMGTCPSFRREFPSPAAQGTYTTTVLAPETRALAALWYLATEDSYRSIGKNFSLHDASVHDAVSSLCKVLTELRPRYIKFPDSEEQEIEMCTFYKQNGFPGVIGCVDGTHIQLVSTDPRKYNRKKRFSINLLLTVNSQEEIIHYTLGAPGSWHDARVYRSGGLQDIVESLPSDRHIIGDSAFPLSMGLMRPYKDTGHLSTSQYRFNFTLSSTRMIVENCNARLKGKWRRLRTIYTKTTSRANLIIEACIVLHNFLLREDAELYRSEDPYLYTMPNFSTPEDKRNFITAHL